MIEINDIASINGGLLMRNHPKLRFIPHERDENDKMIKLLSSRNAKVGDLPAFYKYCRGLIPGRYASTMRLIPKKIAESTPRRLTEASTRFVDRSKVAGRNLPMSYRKKSDAKSFGGCALLE
jgi:hypothetical protein